MASTIEISLPNGLKYKQPTNLFINNKFVNTTGDDFTVYNPAGVTHLRLSIFCQPKQRTDEKIITIRGASAKDVDKTVEAARRAFEGEWSELAAVDRRAFLFKIAELVDRDRKLLASIDAFDNGNTYTAALEGDLDESYNVFRHYAGATDKITGRTIETSPNPWGRHIDQAQELPLHDASLESNPSPAWQHPHPKTNRTNPQHKKILSYIDQGKSSGARLLHGSAKTGSKGYYLEPTVFADTTEDIAIVRDEIFGLAVAIAKFSTVDEVVAKANDTLNGLAAALFAEKVARAHTVARRLQAGMVWINSSGHSHFGIPFGGYKSSGIGSELGQYALDAYTQSKAVHVNLGSKL
ncbi:hypothetical protein CEP53_006833 [Fusarium sp. AF-6]|nr:hypothetical protein CEP53_006833 [Fusarium sp. AF-6]